MGKKGPEMRDTLREEKDGSKSGIKFFGNLGKRLTSGKPARDERLPGAFGPEVENGECLPSLGYSTSPSKTLSRQASQRGGHSAKQAVTSITVVSLNSTPQLEPLPFNGAHGAVVRKPAPNTNPYSSSTNTNQIARPNYPMIPPRTGSNQGTQQSLGRPRAIEQEPLTSHDVDSHSALSPAQNVTNGGKANGRSGTSVAEGGVGIYDSFRGGPLEDPFSSMDGFIRRHNTWEDLSSKNNGVTHVPSSYKVKTQLDDLQERLRRAEEDKTQAEAETRRLAAAVRDDRERDRARGFSEADLDAIRVELDEEKLKTKELKTLLEEAFENTAHLQKVEKNYKTLQENFDALCVDHEQVKAERQDLFDAQDDYNDTISRLLGDFGPHLSDEHFKESYIQLRNDIQLWAEDYFKGPITGLPSPSAVLLEFSKECEDYLESPIMRPKLVQSFIWSVLRTEIFASKDQNSRGLWWAKPRRNQLCGLRGLLQPSEAQMQSRTKQDEKEILEYHRWRATTARLIQTKTDPPTVGFSQSLDYDIIDRILTNLKLFRSDRGRDLSQTTREYKRRLEDIFYFAIQMDHEMNMEIAFYSIEIPEMPVRDERGSPSDLAFDKYSMQVDPAVMRGDGRVECQVVGLIMTPMLLVLGKNDGSEFLDGSRVLLPSFVMPMGALSRQYEDSRRGRRGSDTHQYHGGQRQGSQKRKIGWVFGSSKDS